MTEEMTIEQAVEVVLKGRPWKECTTCLGCGLRFHDLVQTKQGWNMKQADCEPCEGRGHVIRPIYQLALDVLKLSPPTEAPDRVMRHVTVSHDGKCSYR
jgi:hypothetical protein